MQVSLSLHHNMNSACYRSNVFVSSFAGNLVKWSQSFMRCYKKCSEKQNQVRTRGTSGDSVITSLQKKGMTRVKKSNNADHFTAGGLKHTALPHGQKMNQTHY